MSFTSYIINSLASISALIAAIINMFAVFIVLLSLLIG